MSPISGLTTDLHIRQGVLVPDAHTAGPSRYKVQGKSRAGKAQQGLSFIQKLYGIEQAIRKKKPHEKRQIRLERAAPILEQLHAWALGSVDDVVPSSATGKALGYLLEQWPKLIRYLEDGRLPIDNNATERAIRPFVIGRRNWLFADTPKGAAASANLYSLIETAKANSLDPYHYLRYVFSELPKASTLEQVESLLPFKVPAEQLGRLRLSPIALNEKSPGGRMEPPGL